MLDKQMIGRCGTYCGACQWREKAQCPGCQACQGHPFWGECDVAECSLEHGYHHCGQCSEVPCKKLQDTFAAPGHSDDGERLQNLKNWANGGDTYIKLKSQK